MEILSEMRPKFEERGIKIITASSGNSEPQGGALFMGLEKYQFFPDVSSVGYGSNRAIELSRGEYICILDAVSFSHAISFFPTQNTN